MKTEDGSEVLEPEEQSASPPAGDPAAPTYALGGTVTKVTDNHSEALAGARVVAKDESDAVQWTESDDQGKYEFTSLAPGEWTVVAWHESCITEPDQIVALAADKTDLNFALKEGMSGLQLAGTANWQHNHARVEHAQVKAIYRSDNGGTSLIRWAQTDKHGDFGFAPRLRPGTWDLYVLHENGRPFPYRYNLLRSKTDLSLTLWRDEGEADQKAGFWFLVSLILGFVMLAVLYLALTFSNVANLPSEVDLILDQIELAETQFAVGSSRAPTESVPIGALQPSSAAVSNTAPGIAATWQVISETNTSLSAEQKKLVGTTVDGLVEAGANGQSAVVAAHLHNLTTLLAPMSARNSWADEPTRLRDIFFWALFGVIVSHIVTAGRYLRQHRFYREGIYLHVALLVATPIVVVVLVFLLSTVTLSLTVGGAGDLTLDLSDPRILAAVSFLLGVLPWGSWDALRKAAGRLTGDATIS